MKHPGRSRLNGGASSVGSQPAPRGQRTARAYQPAGSSGLAINSAMPKGSGMKGVVETSTVVIGSHSSLYQLRNSPVMAVY